MHWCVLYKTRVQLKVLLEPSLGQKLMSMVHQLLSFSMWKIMAALHHDNMASLAQHRREKFTNGYYSETSHFILDFQGVLSKDKDQINLAMGLSQPAKSLNSKWSPYYHTCIFIVHMLLIYGPLRKWLHLLTYHYTRLFTRVYIFNYLWLLVMFFSPNLCCNMQC